MPAAAQHELIEMRVRDVHRFADHPNPDAHVVLLEERVGTRRLPIWIGREQAIPIALRLEQVPTPRPSAYDLSLSMLGALGGRLLEVRIDRLSEGTFYATVVLDGPRGATEVDARPSDALNLALAAGAPVRVDRGLVEQVVAAQADARAALEAWPGGEVRGSRAILEELMTPPPAGG